MGMRDRLIHALGGVPRASYDAANPSRLRKFHRDRRSPNEQVQRGAVAIRTQARHLARNHDLARGALRVLVNNIVGPKGIGVEPQPRRLDGSIHRAYAADLAELWRDWCRTPEVTHTMGWATLLRAMVRAWARDGEVWGQMLVGTRPDLDHGTRVPFSLEVFEADMVPMDTLGGRVLQGIERNAWGRPVALHVHRFDPQQLGLPLDAGGPLKVIPWDRVLRLATLDHIGQLRGVSEFASVITRLEDIKDFEESERVAAKLAAMLTGYIRKGNADAFVGEDDDEDTNAGRGLMEFAPGMIIDDLQPGEDIGIIDSKRPNPNVVTFRQGQLRAVASGLGASYSSIAKDYSGTYSSQRQELVEQWIHYACLTDDLVADVVQPVWERFVQAADLSGVLRAPRDLRPGSADDALFVGHAMPWIDPLKEAKAHGELLAQRLTSHQEVIRRRGANPDDVLQQVADFERRAREMGVMLGTPGSDPAADAALMQDGPAA